MDCPECGAPTFQYAEGVVSCKNGHRWWEDKDAPRPSNAHLVTHTTVERAGERGLPAWLPGAVLGGSALLVELVRLVA